MSDVASKMGIPEHAFRLVFGRTKIEYDPQKEEINRRKHSYSLESAVHLLERQLLPIRPPPFKTIDVFQERGEVRHKHLTVDDAGNVVLFVTTMRPDETVRVISCRRASKSEREEFRSRPGV